jgi:hypothetical protein
MSVKTSGVGHFTIPTAPAAGTSCTSGAANVFTTTYVQLIASTAAALYITGIYVEEAAVTAGTYIIVQLATGGAGAETIIGQYLIAPVTGSTVTRAYRPIFPPIPVANATRIACKTADSVGAQAKLISLECIAQSNVVDDGIAVGTVTTLTNLPAIPANWITAAGITAAALNGKGDWNIGKTGYSLSAAGVQAIWDALTTALTTVGSIGKRLADDIDALVSSRSTYAGADTAGTTTLLSRVPGTVPVAADYTAARAAKLDNLDVAVSSRSTYAGGAVASVTANVNADVKKINGVTVNGDGAATPWGP